MTLRVLDLFAGIGGFSLGLERVGMRTVAFCEVDTYCQRVLRRHWPDVAIYDDVRSLDGARLAADGIAVDVIAGGFPCQDISVAGQGAGIDGERSGLWREYARLIGEIRPRYAIVENVSALLSRGLGDVLGDLAAIGYDAEWHCIPAAAIGAPHRRDRIWIIARSDGDAARLRQGRAQSEQDLRSSDAGALSGWSGVSADAVGCGASVAYPGSARLPLAQPQGGNGGLLSRADIWLAAERCGWWSVEPDVGRVAHGIPHRVDRLRALGNAIVPQIAEMIGRAIAEAVPR